MTRTSIDANVLQLHTAGELPPALPKNWIEKGKQKLTGQRSFDIDVTHVRAHKKQIVFRVQLLKSSDGWSWLIAIVKGDGVTARRYE